MYESQPGIVVSANLYVPSTGKPPYPGVLFQMGHSGDGKAAVSYQKCCQGLARLGYVVLAFDPMGQGERIAYPSKSGSNTRLGSVDEEHSVPGKQLLLLGDTASRYQVWDAVRGLDYLASHRLVDPHRLASTGQSGGATLTMLLGCVDERLSAVLCLPVIRRTSPAPISTRRGRPMMRSKIHRLRASRIRSMGPALSRCSKAFAGARERPRFFWYLFAAIPEQRPRGI